MILFGVDPRYDPRYVKEILALTKEVISAKQKTIDLQDQIISTQCEIIEQMRPRIKTR